MKIIETLNYVSYSILNHLTRIFRCYRKRGSNPEENKPVLTDNEKKELSSATKERRQNQRLIENM